MATIKFRRGSGQPAGLTAYEPAWDTTNNRLFVNNGSTAVWVGAPIVQDTTLSGNCAWTVPTQNSVKTYIDNSVSAGAVASVNGATGAVTIGSGTGISVTTSTAARGITITNVGVTGLTGTANQITVSGTTGSITLSLPSAITAPGSLATTTSLSVGTDLTVSGNLTVNGTTTTVNSTTVTVQDPLIAIGGVTGNVPPPVGDTKDRGILFQWNNGSTGQTGFFGFDRATQRFGFIPTAAAVSGEIVTGTIGNAEFTGVYAPHGTLTLEGTCASSAQVTIAGGTGINSTVITKVAKRHVFRNGTLSGEECQLEIGSGVNQTPEVYTILKSNAGSLTNSNKTLTFPDFSGSLIAAATSGATSGFILRAAGASSIPTWFDPNTAGFTAFTSTNTALTAIKDTSSYNVIFATGTAGNQVFYADSQAGIRWQPSTDTLTVGSGLGKFEGVIEGGTF